MNHSIKLFFMSIMGSFNMLTGLTEGLPNQEGLTFISSELTYLKPLNRTNEEKVGEAVSCQQILRSKQTSHSDLILFQADLSQCRIVENDRYALAEGADFVTAFNGNDFSCSVLPQGGLEIRPANGSSFQLSVPSIGTPGPVPGGLFDHVKFLAYSLFREAPLMGGELCTTWVGSGKQLHVSNHPFDGAVKNPNEDPRLASFCFVTLDPTLLTTFDWICTNHMIYALVERLPGAEAFFGSYAAYTYLIPVQRRHIGKKENILDDVHTFQTCYNREKGTVTWKLDGRKVFQVSQIGHRLTEKNASIFVKGKKTPLHDPQRFQVLDHGGVDQDIQPTGLQSGLALFSLLDFYPPQTKLNITRNEILSSGRYQGLVRLESNLYRFGTSFYYNNPLKGGRETFFADSTLDPTTNQFLPTIPSNFRLFGQGSMIRLFDYTISIKD